MIDAQKKYKYDKVQKEVTALTISHQKYKDS